MSHETDPQEARIKRSLAQKLKHAEKIAREKAVKECEKFRGLPFTLVLLLVVYSLYIGLKQELFVEDAVRKKLRDVCEEHRLEEAISEVQEELISFIEDSNPAPPEGTH